MFMSRDLGCCMDGVFRVLRADQVEMSGRLHRPWPRQGSISTVDFCLHHFLLRCTCVLSRLSSLITSEELIKLFEWKWWMWSENWSSTNRQNSHNNTAITCLLVDCQQSTCTFTTWISITLICCGVPYVTGFAGFENPDISLPTQAKLISFPCIEWCFRETAPDTCHGLEIDEINKVPSQLKRLVFPSQGLLRVPSGRKQTENDWGDANYVTD